MRFRSFEPTDTEYEAIAAVHNAANPDRTVASNYLRYGDQNRPERVQWGRFVAEDESTRRLVGVALYTQQVWMYDPQQFFLQVSVHPDYQRRGYGLALYRQLETALAPFNPTCLFARGREDQARTMAFLNRLGYQELDRHWESRLDPASANMARYRPLQERLRDEGIVIRTLTEAKKRDEDWAYRIYDLIWEANLSAPSEVPVTRPTFEEFASDFDDPDLLPDAYFIAIAEKENRYVGMSDLAQTPGADNLWTTGFTGVLPDYRRRGIALVLKAAGIAYAQTQGSPTIKTFNNRNNEGMLALNDKLGFVRQPAWIEFKKELTTE